MAGPKLAPMRSLRIWVVLLLASLVLAGCGVRSAYNNLDWLLMRWINGQISLNTEQELSVRSALDDKLMWHCRSELPLYADFLRAVQSDVANDRLDAERFMTHGEQVADFGRRLLERARPDIIELLASLDDEQLAGLRESFAERNQEILEEAESLSDAERQRSQVQGMERGMRRFAGRVTPQQRERLEQWASSLKPTAEPSLAQRLAWQERFFEALELRSDRSRFDPQMAALLEPGADWSEDYRALMEYNRQQTVEALADVHALAPERQLRRLQNRLSGWADDFDRLSCG